jgi:hypothetical protein
VLSLQRGGESFTVSLIPSATRLPPAPVTLA